MNASAFAHPNFDVLVGNQQPPAFCNPQNSPPQDEQQNAIVNRQPQELETSNRNGQNYIDITEYLAMPQSDASKKLGIPTSTLSKRWKEAVQGRKWPYRTICKLDKEIMTLLHNVPSDLRPEDLPKDVGDALTVLLNKRAQEMKPVVIRM